MVSRNGVYDEVLRTLRRIIRAVDLHSKSLAVRYGLTGPQLIILRELDGENGISVGDVANRVSLSPATVTDILDRLEKRCLVERQRSTLDRRRVLVKVTPEGTRMLKLVPTLLQERFEEGFGAIEAWEQTMILASLQRVASLMEAGRIDSSPVLVSGPLGATAEQTVEFLSPVDSISSLEDSSKMNSFGTS